MGKVTRKRYGAEFKARVALETIRGEQTLAELSIRHSIHQTMIAAWKRQAIEGLASIFSGKAEVMQPTGAASHRYNLKTYQTFACKMVEGAGFEPA